MLERRSFMFHCKGEADFFRILAAEWPNCESDGVHGDFIEHWGQLFKHKQFTFSLPLAAY